MKSELGCSLTLSCCKIKKHCDLMAWNATKAAEASSSMMNMVPGLLSVGESSSGTACGHKSWPLVEVLKEISAGIHAFYKSYEVGHKVDEEHIAWVEHWARIMEQHAAMVIVSKCWLPTTFWGLVWVRWRPQKISSHGLMTHSLMMEKVRVWVMI